MLLLTDISVQTINICSEMQGAWTSKAINLIAKNNGLDILSWPNHMRVIEVIKFTKAKLQDWPS